MIDDFIREHNLGKEERAEVLRPYLGEIKELTNSANQGKEKLLIEYLKQNDVRGKFAIVDIGWMGGM